ncbi:hypothetical protein AB0K00_18925 [Dactylosporangium sp. NPDC049525]|uniref:hypothetical protein n=1 Tax=Dactylosporangium sp. NPDC049525 TaxID=3154730 RepID=UPI00343E0043
MSWEFMIHAYRPQHDRARPLLDDRRALPPPETRAWPTVAQLVAAFAVAGLRGQLGFEIAGLDLPQPDWNDYDHARYLGTVYLSDNTARSLSSAVTTTLEMACCWSVQMTTRLRWRQRGSGPDTPVPTDGRVPIWRWISSMTMPVFYERPDR